MLPRVCSVFFFVLLAACTSAGSSVPAPGAGFAAPAASAPAAGSGGGINPATGKKPPLQGLIDMQDIAWHDVQGGEPAFTIDDLNQTFTGLFGGVVINATWDVMQPAQGGALNTTQIDSALAQIQTYNANNPQHPLGVKLRIYAGSSAPMWAQSIDGPPIPIQRNAGGCTSGNCPLTIGRVWDPNYIAAWTAFQTLVAAKYDSNPLIRQVAVTSCTTQTDEPFVATSDKASKTAIDAAGYTDGAYQTCLTGAASATGDYAAWKTTLIDYTFNTFTSMQVGGGVSNAFTQSIMTTCKNSLGAQCIVDNHALMEPLNPGDSIVYSTMQTLGTTVNFQTQAPVPMGCQWTATIARGVQVGAVSIEVWPEAKFKGYDSLTSANVASLASIFTTPIAVPAVPNPLPASCSGFNLTS